MLANSYKKDKSIYTMAMYNTKIEELEEMSRLNDNKSHEEQIEDEKAYIKRVIKIVQDECNKELMRLTANVDSEFKEELDKLTKMWQASNDNLINVVNKETDITVLERASNDMCEIMCSIYNKDFRTYNMIPIWDVTHQARGLNSLVQNYELLIDDYLNTMGSKGLVKFDKTTKGYENRQMIDGEFEKAVLAWDVSKVNDCIKNGAYIDLQLDNSASTALNYSLMHNNQEMTSLLLSNGANANIRGVMKNSAGKVVPIVPVLYAIKKERYDYISQMIINGAEIDTSMFDKILKSGDDILIERILNETDIYKTEVNSLKGPISRQLKNYMRRNENIDIIVKMYNRGLFTLDGMEGLFFETNNIAILKAMDKLGYKFDFSRDDLKFNYARFVLRIIIERDMPDAVDFVLSKFKNFDFASDMESDGNLSRIKEYIERNADVVTLKKLVMADPKLNLRSFTIKLPKEKFLDIEYINKAKELEKLNANISYQTLGVGKNFDSLIEKMVRGDKSYKEQRISERELMSFDTLNNNICHYIAVFGDLEDLEMAKNNMDVPNTNGYTPLALAMLNKNYAICNRLLDNNDVQLDRIFEGENTYLHYAVQSGSLDLVKKLINHQAKQMPNIEGQTPIYLSIQLNKTDIAKELITKANEYGEEALMYAAQYGNIDIAKLLISRGMDVNRKDEMGNTALFEAVKNQNRSMIKLLVKNNANIDVKNELFETPIMYAVKNNLKESVDELIDLGANLILAEETVVPKAVQSKYGKDMHMGSGKTLLHYAKDKKMMRLLMINGSNPYQKDAHGKYAFDVLTLTEQYRKLEQEINKGIFNKDEVNKIIKEMGEDINLPNPYKLNFTAVSYAAYKGNLDVLKALVKNGGDINVYDSGHTDALMTAVIAKKENCAMYLIEKGANLEHTDRIGNNALMIAIYNGLDNVAKTIIDKGINLDKSTPYGNPLLVAIECKKVDIIKQLIDKNVDIKVRNMMGVPAYKLIENLRGDYRIEDREYKILDDILKSKVLEKGKGLGFTSKI